MARLMTALLAVVASLAAASLFAQTHPSTPTVALETLVAAVEREDVAEVGELIELPLKLETDRLGLFAQRYILGSKLFWLLDAKFGERDAQRVMRIARLDYLPRVDAQRLNWRAHEVPGRPGVDDRREGAIGSDPDSPRRLVRMVKTDQGWKANLDHGMPALLVLDVEDAPWRNRRMRQAIDDLNSGKLTTIEQVIGALLPRAPEQRELVKADRSTPAGAILAAAEAIEKGDVATLTDSFEMIGGDDGGFLRRAAEQAVLERKVENLVRGKFAPEQADRIVKQAGLRRGLLVMYQNVAGWDVDGDVARAAFEEGFYDVARRMVRRDGIWRAQLPPRSTMPRVDDESEKLRQAVRVRAMRDVLDHPERFGTPGALLDALDVTRQDPAPQIDEAAEARRQLEEVKREMAKNPPRTPEEAEEHALALALWEIGAAVASKDAKEAAKHYFATGDDGSYTLARQKRLLAAMDLGLAASKEIGDGTGSLLHEFELTNHADDIYGLFMSELKIQGDRAVPTQDAPDDEWMPGIRKIAGRWKIDVTDETGGNPQAAAARADDEANKLTALAAQVKAGKFIHVDQLRKAMKDAGIRGAGISRR